MSYFATWYLQITVAIAFRVIWTIVYNNSQLMGHFCRLASPGGVTEKDALDSLLVIFNEVNLLARLSYQIGIYQWAQLSPSLFRPCYMAIATRSWYQESPT